MKVEIASTDLDDRSGTSQAGKPYRIIKQTGYAFIGGKYPEKISIRIEENQAPYSVGMYELDDSSFYVDKFGGLAVSPVLVSIK